MRTIADLEASPAFERLINPHVDNETLSTEAQMSFKYDLLKFIETVTEKLCEDAYREGYDAGVCETY